MRYDYCTRCRMNLVSRVIRKGVSLGFTKAQEQTTGNAWLASAPNPDGLCDHCRQHLADADRLIKRPIILNSEGVA